MKDKIAETCALQLKGVKKDYGSGEFLVQALKGVDVNFRKNEFVSILGPSGCGKTTLLNIIGGLDRYSSGDLIIDGRSTKNYKDKDWDAYRNNCIGFVFQSYNLIPHQTVLGNVEIALELSGVSKKERRKRALEVLDKVGLKEQAYKKPNQLSGGQMQRVAIARALVNDPEIILADEPTGALDSETSIQVINLLKEVAKDRLVIMVTHNPELAETYSTRIIKLLDGEIVGDTNPYSAEEQVSTKNMRKPKMGFKTAFLLSLKNLFSKRARTILTSIAGSIGIIGVGLVLALSNGFNLYMARMQTETLSANPLMISENAVDLSTFTDLYNNELKEKYPELDNVVVENMFSKLRGMLQKNVISDTSENGFLTYLQNHRENNPSYYYDIKYSYGFDVNNYIYTDVSMSVKGSEKSTSFLAVDNLVQTIQKQFDSQVMDALGFDTAFVRQFIPTINEMPASTELIKSQYDLIYNVEGEDYPTFADEDYNKIYLVVDSYNGVNDLTLALLGYLGINIPEDGNVTFDGGVTKEDGTLTIPLEDILGKKFYLAKNDLMYSKMGEGYVANPLTKDTEGLVPLEIVGILRPKENVTGALDTGIAYSPALSKKVLLDNKDSQIKGDLVDENGALTKTVKITFPMMGIEQEYNARTLSLVNTPSEIEIFAKDFESKEIIKDYIDAWNDAQTNETLKISYSDTMSMMFDMLTTMVQAVTYVLVAFTSISLIVSSVMIGIITYISVVERTKEIGVLRALGASKGEISNVFNAETFIIGLIMGTLGIAITYLLSIPINLLIGAFVPGIGSIAILQPYVALTLIGISIVLTLVAGLIPSRIATKKDPVVALRSE